jgi:hypothetical protein
MTATAKIRTALENHLNTTTPALPAIAWDNVPFTQDAGTTYIQAVFEPLTRRPAVRGPNPQHRHEGDFVLTICTPQDEGSGPATALADQLQARFNGSTSVIGPQINVSIDFSEIGVGFHRPPFFCIPLRISWYAYA